METYFKGDNKMSTKINTNSSLKKYDAKMELRIKVSPEYADKYNDWLFDFFGGKRIFYKSMDRVLCHPDNAKYFQE